MHVTMRLEEGLENLRTPRSYAVVRDALRRGKQYGGFRLYQFSVQSNHMHMIVEASDRVALSRGMQALAIRIAKSLNLAWGRSGKVFAERYHALVLRSARQIRNALRYVLTNANKHTRWVANHFDPCSSALWFDGWLNLWGKAWPGLPLDRADVPVVAARGFLLRVGWRRWGLLDPGDCPKGAL